MSNLVEAKINVMAKQADESGGCGCSNIVKLINKFNLDCVAEIGVSFGGHAESMLTNSKVEKLYGIDPYKHYQEHDNLTNLSQIEFDELYNFVKNRLSKYENRYEHIRMLSGEAIGEIIGQLDGVFIDANHTYEGILDDLSIWFLKIRDGGIIGGHEYDHRNYQDVKKGIDEFFNRFGWVVNQEGESAWWVQKQNLNVSYFIPAYNCSKTICESIDSIMKSNFDDGDELIIVNDGSTDDTDAALEEIQKQLPGISIVNHAINKGGAAARNTAVETSKNCLLFCLDSDNILVPSSIAKLKEYLITSVADVASFGELHYFNKDKEVITHKWLFEKGRVTLSDCLSNYKVPGASGNYMFTKESWIRAGGYPEFAGALDAWGFGFRQLATGQKMMVMENSYYYHRHGHNSYWVREAKKGKLSLVALQIMIPYLDKFYEKDIDYIMSKKGRNNWFQTIEERPVRLASNLVDRYRFGVRKFIRRAFGC